MNKITNVLGVLLIVSAPLSVFFLEKVLWSDAIWGVTVGIGLIYTKNTSFASKIIEVLKGKGASNV